MPIGELAAVATAGLFAISSVFFTVASRQAGSTAVNRSRLLVAAGVAMLLLWAVHGSPLPRGAPGTAWLWLSASGIIGLALGDESLFRAYVLIGPSRSMLVFAMAPAIAAVLGYALFGEVLSAREIAGIAVTLGGIAWVVASPRDAVAARSTSPSTRGLLWALGGALGQALGLITAKLGMEHGVAPQSANTIRLVAGAIAVWLAVAVSSRARPRPLAPRASRWRSTSYTVIGSLIGPVAGVWLSLVAIERAPVGIASTLMSLTPLFILPIARLVFGEAITLRAIGGTCIALAGTALLLLGRPA